MKALQIFFAILLSAALLISFPAFSQFGFGVGAGVQQINVSALNDFHKKNELPEFKQFQFLRSPVFFMGTKKFFLEMGYEWVNASAENNISKAEFTSNFAVVNFAVNFSKNNRHRIFPLVGFGPGIMRLDYSEKTAVNTTFPNFISSSPKNHTLRTDRNGGVIRLGAGWHYIIGGDIYGKGNASPSIGIQAGYNIPIFKYKWETLDGQEVTDVPTVNTQGFYAKLSLQFF